MENLFARYNFGKKYPGDRSHADYGTDTRWGFLPYYSKGSFKLHDEEKRRMCGNTIKALDTYPDLLCLQEVESLLALRIFNEEFLGNHYPYALLIDSRDFRQIDVGILSARPILSVRSHVDDRDDQGDYLFSRDCLEVVVLLDGHGTTLTLFLNHLKSKYADTPQETATANDKRRKQAQAVARIVRERFPGSSFNTELFAVIGDLNDQPQSPHLEPIVQGLGLENVVERLPAKERWTHWWRRENKVSQLDYILVSPAISQSGVGQPHIERSGLSFRKPSAVDGKPLPRQSTLMTYDGDPGTRVDFRFPRLTEVTEKHYCSDHCPVFFRIET